MVRHTLAFLLPFILVATVAAKTLSGRIVGVSDGDTVTLLTAEKKQVKIRLYGIDAPESHQAFGQASKKALSDLVFGKDIEAEVKATDRYGRTVGVLRLGRVNINEAQVEAGMAWWYRAYAKGETRFEELESAARKRRIGLWQDADPVPPWEFRRKSRK